MARQKKKPPDPKPLEQKSLMVVKKTALKNIIKNDHVNGIIQEVVQRTHVVNFHTTHFLKHYLNYLYERDQEFSTIDCNFIDVCNKTVSNIPEKRRGKPSAPETQEKLNILKEFYQEHYEPLMEKPKEMRASLEKLGYVTQYEEIDIVTNIKNNIIAHFESRCNELVNRTFQLKQNLKVIDEEHLSKEEKILKKRVFSNRLRKVKQDLFSPPCSEYESHREYHEWLDFHKSKIIQKELFEEFLLDKNMKREMMTNLQKFKYDIKADPLSYLPGFFHLSQELEVFESYFQTIPLKTSNIPSYITIDTSAMIQLFAEKGKQGAMLKKVEESKEKIWSTNFRLDDCAFKKKDYSFHHIIQTDGVGASILFHRKDYENKKDLEQNKKLKRKLKKDLEKKVNAASKKEQYIDNANNDEDNQLTPEEYVELRGFLNVVGIDPGRNDILYCTDGDETLRYSAMQRKQQTKSKKYQKIRDSLKKFTEIDSLSVKEWETVLSACKKKTCNFQEFKEYLELKLPITFKLSEFYSSFIFRKLRWNGYMNRQRSEDKMLNQFEEKFGGPQDMIIVIGDWEQHKHMRGREPTKGKGMRKVLRKRGYKVFLVDEHKTSCTCHNCHGRTEKFLKCQSKKKKSKGKNITVHGLLRCQSLHECRTLWNRDVNGALNIRMLGLKAIHEEIRPGAFCRGKSLKNVLGCWGVTEMIRGGIA